MWTGEQQKTFRRYSNLVIILIILGGGFVLYDTVERNKNLCNKALYRQDCTWHVFKEQCTCSGVLYGQPNLTIPIQLDSSSQQAYDKYQQQLRELEELVTTQGILNHNKTYKAIPPSTP